MERLFLVSPDRFLPVVRVVVMLPEVLQEEGVLQRFDVLGVASLVDLVLELARFGG